MKWLSSNEPKYRLLRTIVQGVIGVFVSNADIFLGYIVFDPAMRGLITALIMAILSPVMAALGANTNVQDEDIVNG